MSASMPHRTFRVLALAIAILGIAALATKPASAYLLRSLDMEGETDG